MYSNIYQVPRGGGNWASVPALVGQAQGQSSWPTRGFYPKVKDNNFPLEFLWTLTRHEQVLHAYIVISENI